jgi:arylsulfatase A-like enzyme
VLGEFIRTFEEAGLGDDTIFLIFADHGEAFGQHRGNFNHPFFIYEENVHVPFLIYNRQLFAKRVDYRGISRHTDILPTVLDMVGLSEAGDPRHEGRSLLAGGPPQIATFYTSWRNRLAGLRDGRWKYIYNLQTGREELYDLQKDPGERLSVANPAVQERYRDYLFELTVYQRKYYQRVLNRRIDWAATQEKDESVVREEAPEPAQADSRSQKQPAVSGPLNGKLPDPAPTAPREGQD